MLRAAKIDANQPQIIAALRKAGAVVVITSQLKNAFDCIVCFRGQIYICEIKDGNKPPSARKLSEGEIRCKELIESVGCKYNVVESTEQALQLIGAK